MTSLDDVYTKIETDLAIQNSLVSYPPRSEVESKLSLRATSTDLQQTKTALSNLQAVTNLKANASAVYTKEETDTKVAVSLQPYRLTTDQDVIDATLSTKAEVDTKIALALQPYRTSTDQTAIDNTLSTKAEVDTKVALALQSYRTSTAQTAIDNTLSTKAEVDTKVALALQSYRTSTDQTAIDNTLSTKTEVDTKVALALQPYRTTTDQNAIDATLATKTEVEAALALKADASDVPSMTSFSESLATKASLDNLSAVQSTLNASIAQKFNTSAFNTFSNSVNTQLQNLRLAFEGPSAPEDVQGFTQVFHDGVIRSLGVTGDALSLQVANDGKGIVLSCTVTEVAGPTGPAGAQGTAGAQGVAGAQGAAGPTGPAGAQGTAGAQGAAGPTGPAGSGGSFDAISRALYGLPPALPKVTDLYGFYVPSSVKSASAWGDLYGSGADLVMDSSISLSSHTDSLRRTSQTLSCLRLPGAVDVRSVMIAFKWGTAASTGNFYFMTQSGKYVSVRSTDFLATYSGPSPSFYINNVRIKDTDGLPAGSSAPPSTLFTNQWHVLIFNNFIGGPWAFIDFFCRGDSNWGNASESIPVGAQIGCIALYNTVLTTSEISTNTAWALSRFGKVP